MGLATSIFIVCIHDNINTCELLVLQAGCIGSKRYATASKGQYKWVEEISRES